jgi:Mn2+/Fe2+ NRAMP family transporter
MDISTVALMIIGLFFYIYPCHVVSSIAGRHGRSYLINFVLCLLLTPVFMLFPVLGMVENKRYLDHEEVKTLIKRIQSDKI